MIPQGGAGLLASLLPPETLMALSCARHLNSCELRHAIAVPCLEDGASQKSVLFLKK